MTINKNKLLKILDFFIISFILFHLLSGILLPIIDTLHLNYQLSSDILCTMSSTGDNNTSSSTTSTQIIHDDGSWSNAIRTIFIYGSGALRFTASRTSARRGFVVISSLLGDGASRVVTNAINDPEYLRNHAVNWRAIWTDSTTTSVHLDPETLKKAEAASSNSINNNSSSSLTGTDFNAYIDNSLDSIIGYLKPILEPIQVSYSNEVLAEQINGIAIMLFLLSIIIIVLFIFFSLNAIILIYRDRIVNYFSNKYIRAYLKLNSSIIAIELFITSITILYFLFTMSKGLQFIARHPIIFTS